MYATCHPHFSALLLPPQGVPNNYETDLIFPIVQRAAGIAGVDYHQADPATKTALKARGQSLTPHPAPHLTYIPCFPTRYFPALHLISSYPCR